MSQPGQTLNASGQQYRRGNISPNMRHINTSTTTGSTTSAPPTPLAAVGRRTSHPATSPITSTHSPQPKPIRRVSSTASLNRTPSSPKLAHKASRTSLGGAQEEREKRVTPKRSISNLIVNLREAQSVADLIEEPVPLTAPQIAIEHFTNILAQQADSSTDAQTVVIIHDACYGHRYSRLKATKATLSMIVERPERINASILGASTAYVRLGRHHAGAEHAPYPGRAPTSRPPFKIQRTARSIEVTSSIVTNVHGTSWMTELESMCHAAPEKLACGDKELARIPMPGQSPKEQLHEGDLYLAPGSLAAFQGALGGVADSIDAVFDSSTPTKRAFVAVRPPGHHCSSDHPSGFCWLNNVHVGIEYAAQTYGLTHAAIFDFDLHHGDGSQSITWERNSKNNAKRLSGKSTSKLKLGPDIGYYSLHDINSYPCETGDDDKVQAASLCIENAHGQSIWNVHLQPWKTEDEFWKLYENRYRVLLDKARDFLRLHTSRVKNEGKAQPKAAVFISAGFDASEWEGAGMQRHKVNVPTEFYARFTRDMVELAQEADLGCQGRVISVLEGGYSDRALCSGVLSHLSGLCARPISAKTNGFGSLLDLSEKMSGLTLTVEQGLFYDKEWWSASNLTALEDKVNPPPPAQSKKARSGPQPTYATPTESFAYKVVDPARFARSVSGTMREMPIASRPPTPPPPEVDWVVATQEFSKLLIPTDRQTKSCTAEELGGVRVKKELQANLNPRPIEDSTRTRQLRDRKGKALPYAPSNHSDENASVRSVSRSSRRETIDVLPVSEKSVTARRSSRRLSAGSNLGFNVVEIDHAAPPVPALPSRLPTNGVPDRTMKPPAPPNGNIQVKKARAPQKPRKVSPVSNVPVLSDKTTDPDVIHDNVKVAQTGLNVSKTNGEHASTGVKKLTLKVSGTKEEHDRRQKEKLDAERRARALKGAETRRINAAAKKAAKENSASSPISPIDMVVPQSIHPEVKVDQPVNQLNGLTSADEYVNPLSANVPIHGFDGAFDAVNSDDMSFTVPSVPGSDADHSWAATSESTTTEPQIMVPPQEMLQDHQHVNIVSEENESFKAVPTLSPVKTSPLNETYNQSVPSIVPIVSQDNETVKEENAIITDGHTTAPSGSVTSNNPSTQRPSASKLPVWTSTGPIPFAAPGPQPVNHSSNVDESDNMDLSA